MEKNESFFLFAGDFLLLFPFGCKKEGDGNNYLLVVLTVSC